MGGTDRAYRNRKLSSIWGTYLRVSDRRMNAIASGDVALALRLSQRLELWACRIGGFATLGQCKEAHADYGPGGPYAVEPRSPRPLG